MNTSLEKEKQKASKRILEQEKKKDEAKDLAELGKKWDTLKNKRLDKLN